METSAEVTKLNFGPESFFFPFYLLRAKSSPPASSSFSSLLRPMRPPSEVGPRMPYCLVNILTVFVKLG